MTESLLLGVDVGTGSSKAVLSTPDGRIVATASRPHAMSLPRPGWAEMAAEAIWWDEVVSLIRELVDSAGGAPIAGLSVSGVGPCLLLTDADLNPLRPAILYGIDMRAVEQIRSMTESFGADAILANGGTALSSQAVGPKMAWVQEHEPDVWAKARRWFNSSSFAVARLTGEYVLDHHTASQCDPLYDIHAFDWNAEWAERVAPGLAMPRLAWPSEVVGQVHAAASAATGLPVGTPVVAGTVDAWAEGFSAGATRPGDLMLMYGSTMFFVQVLREYVSHPGLWTTAGVLPGTHTLAAGMSTSGSLTSWLQQLTGGAPFGDLVTEAARVPAGSDGLLLLPYFAGERTPIFDAQARGLVLGLTLSHTRGHLFRAAYEGIAFGIRQIVELLAAGDPPERLVAVGGGTQGGLWTQIVSDVTGRPQDVPEETIGASYGGALMAALGTGLVPEGTSWARVARTVEPNPEVREMYDGLYQGYTELYPATREHMHRLARLQESAHA